MALPSGYTPLEYIESTGSQYVDTGFAPGYTSGYRIDFQLTTASSSDLTLMGSLNPNICFLGGNSQFQYAYKSGTGASGSFGANDTKRHVWSLNFRNDQKAILDQTSKDLTAMSEDNAKTAYIFASHYDKPIVYGQISARAFRVEMSNGANLVRDFIPCTNPSGEVGLYDDVNGVFYGDAAGVGFVAGPVAIYTELEYIESSGTQRIDTRFKPNQDTRVVAKTLCFNQSAIRWVFGARRDANNDIYNFFASSAGTYRSSYGTQMSANFDASVALTAPFIVDKNKNVTTIDGEYTYNCTVEVFSSPVSMYLFACNTNGTTTTGSAGVRIYYCKIYDNGALIRDYIPVQRLDGSVGLLDQVNNVFYPDAASGNFIAGPLAARPEAPASLEVIGTTRNAAILAWPGAPVGQNYRLYRDGVVVYEGSALCYTDACLAAGSAHVYSVHTLSGSTESEGVTTEATTTDGIVLITDRTAADVSAGRRKGYYNALDLIRVGEAVLYVQSILNGKTGFNISVSAKTDWQLDDIPTRAQMNTYLENIRRIHSIVQEYLTTATIPGNMDSLTWKEANAIESILIDAETMMHDIMLSNHNYSGRTISGVLTLP